MTREEAIAKGITPDETRHSMERRSLWHDYSHEGTYMITLVTAGRLPLFGTLQGDMNARRGSEAYPSIRLSPLGRAIEENELPKIHSHYPMVEVWKVCFMPDHIHMILRVSADLPEGKSLGWVIRGFKSGCSREWWKSGLAPITPGVKTPGTVAGRRAWGTPGTVAGRRAWTGSRAASVPSVFTEGTSLFQPGYNDKILLRPGQLSNWKRYLDDNPRRLLLKRHNPQLFTVLHHLKVAGRDCQAVGNRFLLDIPDKVAVIVHRRYTPDERARLRASWLACGEGGGVLVSAAIAPDEKAVLREALERGYRIILLRENGFPDLYKPSGESFDACSDGRLLQLSPWAYHMDRKTITRSQCLELNALAELIAGL